MRLAYILVTCHGRRLTYKGAGDNQLPNKHTDQETRGNKKMIT